MNVAKMGEACLNLETGVRPMTTFVSPSLPWFALKVRTHSEPKAALALRNRGYDPFCPVYPERQRYSDRVKVVEKALFPGYLFCRFDVQKKLPILNSGAVEYIVSVAGLPAHIPDDELARIRRAVEAGARPAAYLKTGQRVRIQSGPFAGIEGVLASEAGKDKLVLSIDVIQGAIALHIDKDQVCPVTTSASERRPF